MSLTQNNLNSISRLVYEGGSPTNYVKKFDVLLFIWTETWCSHFSLCYKISENYIFIPIDS